MNCITHTEGFGLYESVYENYANNTFLQILSPKPTSSAQIGNEAQTLNVVVFVYSNQLAVFNVQKALGVTWALGRRITI